LNSPRDETVAILADKVGIDKALFYLPHQEFIAEIAKSTPLLVDFSSITPKITFASIEKWRHLWNECASKHSGTYVLYTRVLSNPTIVAKSLLLIKSVCADGITFALYNVDDRNRPLYPTIYVYNGLMFPVYECLCFYAEEQSHNELLALITSSSQAKIPSFLTGFLIAVGVTPEMRRPGGTKAVLVFQTRRIGGIAESLKFLGIVSRAQVDSRVQELLFSE
jgi:hypothetical protein